MTLLDLLIIFVFFLAAWLGKIPINAFSIMILVGIICLERVLKGEKL